MLLEHHRTMLEVESGIDPKVIEARGYQSIDRYDLTSHHGFTDIQKPNGKALLIPMWGLSGEIVGYQMRPDKPFVNKEGKAMKYVSPFNSTNFLDIHPLMRERLLNPVTSIYITEGAKKADCFASLGLPCIALKGVWNWRGKDSNGQYTALADWHDVPIRGNRFVIVFDNDIYTNRSVNKALKELKNYLIYKKADQVGHMELPYDPTQKIGVDDYMASIR